ncbi:hypothetical protein [Kiloniella litopenaei]|uniref:hypothetical protein n=1 Tax=Kiloniella litopenaei TaxID=1549748 RepID=UPI003BAA1E9E
MKTSGKHSDTSLPLTNNIGVNAPSSNTGEAEEKYSTPFLYSADNPPAPKPPRVECYLDRENHIRHMVYIGTLHHEQLVPEVVEIWKSIEHLERYNNLIDLRFHKGDVGWHTVKK